MMASLRQLLPALLLAPLLPTSAQDRKPVEVPEDLLADDHVREELAINEFTAPSISKLFEQLEALQPLPVKEVELKLPKAPPLDRADLSLEIGFLIADGFLVVQSGNLDRVEELAKKLSHYGKSLGAGDRVNRHAAALLESAEDEDIDKLKKELAATQKDVEIELVNLRDADLAHLISLGGWIRALDVASTAVTKGYTPERAKRLMREDIADYYEYSVGSLEPRISERPNFVQMREILSGLRNEMTLGDDKEATKERVATIREGSAKLVKLALERQQ